MSVEDTASNLTVAYDNRSLTQAEHDKTIMNTYEYPKRNKDVSVVLPGKLLPQASTCFHSFGCKLIHIHVLDEE